jgi:GR25 family glycosyltransferase involved in LPS biosynthesis
MFNKIIYINLDRRPDRNTNILNEISKIGFDGPVERFSAVNGKTLSNEDIIKNFTPKASDEALKKDIKNVQGNRMTYGAMGQCMSLKTILEKIVVGPDEYVLILEDDIYFVDNFLEKFKKFVDKVPEYDLLYPGYHNSNDFQELEDYTIPKNMWGLHSIIVNKKAATEILKLFPLDNQFDTEIQNIFPNLKIYATNFNEKLVITPNDDSDIQIIENFKHLLKKINNNKSYLFNLYILYLIIIGTLLCSCRLLEKY